MSIWNKVLAWLVGIAALAFLVLAAFSLKIHEHWQSAAQRLEQKIAQVEAANQKLAEGDDKVDQPAQMSIRQLRVQLANLLVGRRRVWSNCNPKVTVNRENATAEIALTIEQPDPTGIAEKTVLFAFQEAEVQKRGRYMGEFRVTKSAGKDVTIVPTAALTTRELDRLEAASGAGPWVLCESMPRDGHEVFAGVGDAELRAMLPQETVREYLKDGKPAGKDDAEERVNKETGKYVRELRDYSYLFNADAENRAIMTEQMAAATHDKQLLDESLALARKQEQAGKDDVDKAKQEFATRDRERKAVSGLNAQVASTLKKVEAAIDELLKDNQAKAGRIAEQQWKATQRIDERTRAMAQSGTGRR